MIVVLCSKAQSLEFNFWSLTQVFNKIVWVLSLLSIIAFGGFLCFSLCLTSDSVTPKLPLTTKISMSFWHSYSIFIGENVPFSKHFMAVRHIM